MPHLSVIVPLYNAEQYLANCLDSLLAQSFTDIEVICVNDGSSDKSGEIAAKYAAADGRFTLIDKPNGGPSSARNVGIREAHGTYVCFLDADDTYTPNACGRIASAFDSGLYDIVVFGGNCLPADRADRRIVDALSPRAADYPRFDPALLFSDRTHPYIRFAIRREFLLEGGFFFDEELRVGEEEALVFNIFPAANGVKVIPDKLYNYHQFHDGSQMSDATRTVERQCTIDQGVAEHVFRDCRANGLVASYPVELVWWSVRFSVYSILRQEPEIRDPLVIRVRNMWLSYCTDEELLATASVPSLQRIVEIVLDAAPDGSLTTEERTVAKALRTWRLAEYGIIDALITAAERIKIF